jgi:hypothetical protein
VAEWAFDAFLSVTGLGAFERFSIRGRDGNEYRLF